MIVFHYDPEEGLEINPEEIYCPECRRNYEEEKEKQTSSNPESKRGEEGCEKPPPNGH